MAFVTFCLTFSDTIHDRKWHYYGTAWFEPRPTKRMATSVIWVGVQVKLSPTVNSEIFARFLISRIALKDIFATLKIRDYRMINLYQ